MAAKIITSSLGPGQTNAGLAIAVIQKPLVEFLLYLLQLGFGLVGVGRHDHELTGGIDDLAGRRKILSVQYFQRGAFTEQRHIKRAAAQQLSGALVGFAAIGKDEILDAEKVALYQQIFLLLPAIS